MSKVLDAPVAASSPAPVAAPNTAAAAEPATPQARRDALGVEDRAHYNLTGEFPEDRTPKAESSPAVEDQAQVTDSPSDAENGSESASDTETQEPVTPVQSEKSKRAKAKNDERWEMMVEERGKLKAENELLRKQLAEGTAPKTSTEKKESAESAPAKRPRLSQYPGTDEGIAQYEDDLEAYLDAKTEKRLEDRFTREKSEVERTKGFESWKSRVDSAKAEYPDFEAVADKAPVSGVVLEVISKHADGAKILYHLGLPANAALAKQIVEESGLSHLNVSGVRAALTNPDVREALGVARAELNHFAKSLTAKKAPDKGTTEKVSTYRPSSEVTVPAKGTPLGDAIEDAIKRKDSAAYRKLVNEQEARAARH